MGKGDNKKIRYQKKPQGKESKKMQEQFKKKTTREEKVKTVKTAYFDIHQQTSQANKNKTTRYIYH